MGKHRSKNAPFRQVRTGFKAIRRSSGLPFRAVLDGGIFQRVLEELEYEYRERVYDPYVTVSAFLSQVIDQGACETAVVRVITDRVSRGEKAPSSNTTSYTEARQRLPEELFLRTVQELGREMERQVPDKWLWKDRHVKVVDGSTFTMTDTPENQQEYPQHSNQEAGLGFPSARIGVLFSLATGMVLNAAIGPIKGKGTGEIELFRQMFGSLQHGDIVLGDSLYDSYRDIAELRKRKVDVLFGMKHSRNADFRKGKRLGPRDHEVVWTKPRFDSTRMNRKTWEALPDTMTMRELTITVRIRGRFEKIRIVTTLLDSSVYSAEDVTNLFQKRWNVELDIRSLKTIMGMNHLVCKTPSMIRKEFYAYLMAYNLIRARMAQAAHLHDKKPRELSFSAARTILRSFLPLIAATRSKKARAAFERQMVDLIATRTVGDRPGRAEPRKIKRRPQQKFPYLKSTRKEEQKRLAA